MAGYNWLRGMSKRAVRAYEEGRIPLSKIKKSDLQSHGISLSVSDIRLAVKYNIISSNEYHHTSKFFNQTFFYDLNRIKEEQEYIARTVELAKDLEKKKKLIKKIATGCNVTFSKFHVAIKCNNKTHADGVIEVLKTELVGLEVYQFDSTIEIFFEHF